MFISKLIKGDSFGLITFNSQAKTIVSLERI